MEVSPNGHVGIAGGLCGSHLFLMLLRIVLGNSLVGSPTSPTGPPHGFPVGFRVEGQ